MKRLVRRIRRFVKREPVRAGVLVSLACGVVAHRFGLDGDQLLLAASAILGVGGEAVRSRVSPVDRAPADRALP